MYLKVEMSEAGSKLTEFHLSADADSRGIRQSDLRDVLVRAAVEDVVANFAYRIERGAEVEATGVTGQDTAVAYTDALRAVRRARSGRDITPELLERVAAIYRENISGHPTAAVQHHFQVGQRMAAEYVSRARRRGFLPPTKRGKKQA